MNQGKRITECAITRPLTPDTCSTCDGYFRSKIGLISNHPTRKIQVRVVRKMWVADNLSRQTNYLILDAVHDDIMESHRFDLNWKRFWMFCIIGPGFSPPSTLQRDRVNAIYGRKIYLNSVYHFWNCLKKSNVLFKPNHRLSHTTT